MERKTMISTKMLVEGAMMIAIATVLSFIKMQTPLWINGGSVTAGSMIPLLIFAYRWGGTRGMFVGAVYGLLQFFIEPYAAHPLSIVLDYPLAFGLIGMAGYLANAGASSIKVAYGITLGLFGRFMAHFLSGFIFFASYAPEGTHPVLYSLIYNGSYMVPELVISLVIFFLLKKPLSNVK